MKRDPSASVLSIKIPTVCANATDQQHATAAKIRANFFMGIYFKDMHINTRYIP